ncbi:MAG: protein translocase subunit SecD [Acidimicrobiia bacterium]|nr:protein translocase subunit SecD [Acidimicrobiia bacterium]
MRRNHVLLFGTVLLVAVALATTIAVGDRPVLGLDLQGGISLRLIPVGDEGTDWDADGLDQAVDIIRQRVDALGVAEPEITREGDSIVVQLPGVKDRDKAEQLVGQTAELRFRPVLRALPADQFDENGVLITEPENPEDSTTTTVAGDAPEGTPTTVAGEAPGTTTASSAPTTTTSVPEATTTTAAPDAPADPADPNAEGQAACPDTTEITITDRADDRPECAVVLPDRDGEIVYVMGPAELTGTAVDTASAQFLQPGQQQSGSAPWVVNVDFTGEGGDDFVSKIAEPYVGQQVAIVLDGVVQSAPTINPGITSGEGVQITGDFSEGEARDLATVLRFGSLPVVLEQEAAVAVSPTLGRDQLAAGLVAGLIGLALVALFMVWYYRILGLVVVGGLLVEAGALWALVAYLADSIGLALTLAGVTGLIVSIGVTVDSFIVYFERLRDEIRTGKTIRSAVDKGFQRSFRTIITADTVSLIGSALLYWLAIGAVRGFAFFLFLSTALDIVVAYTFMHPLTAVIARSPRMVRARWIGLAAALRAGDARR